MIRYLVRRLLMLIPLFLGITLITFAVIHLAPGEPVEMQIAMNPKVGAEARERLRKFYGLDKPLPVQYGEWLGRLARLDFGRSFAPDNRPVAAKIRERIPVTLSLNVIALVIEFGLAIPIGVLAAIRRDTFWTRGSPYSSSSASPCRPSGWPFFSCISSASSSAGSLSQDYTL